MVKPRKSLVLILALALLAIPVAAQANAEYKNSCSLATLQGTYGDFEEGTVLAQFPGLPAPPFPVVLVGMVTYDGAGNVSATYTASMGGVILPGTGTGTYTVNPDCTYSDAITEPNGPGGHHVGAITGKGMFQEVHAMYIDPWLVASGTLRKTPAGGCSQKTLKGTYAVFGQGWLTPPGLSSLVPAAHAGIFAANGKGSFHGDDTISIAGNTMPDSFTATYTINADCTIFAEITTSMGVIHEAGTITGKWGFQESHKIITDPGWVFAETDKKEWPVNSH